MKITKINDRDLYRGYVKLPDGKYKQIYGKTEKEVEQKAEKLKHEIATGLYREPQNVTVSMWYDHWKNTYLMNVKDLTSRTYKRICKNYILPEFGDTKLQSIENRDIQNFIDKLYIQNRLSAKTIKNVATVLRRLFKDAISYGIIAVNPAVGVTLPRVQTKTMNILKENDIPRFLNACENLYPMYAPYFEFMLQTGLRFGEFVGATIEQYNPYDKTFLIDKQALITSKYKESSPKHDIIRKIALNDRCAQIVESCIKQTMDIRSEGVADYNPGNYIFVNLDGTHIKSSTFHKYFKIITESIGLPGLRIHDLRHTYATLALESGMDIKTLQQNLGHSDPGFTLRRYAHSTDRMQRESAQRFGDFFNSLL